MLNYECLQGEECCLAQCCYCCGCVMHLPHKPCAPKPVLDVATKPGTVICSEYCCMFVILFVTSMWALQPA